MEYTPGTVLIADGSEDFCKELQSILRYSCKVRTCCRGRRALKLIQELRPQVLVLDLMLPELDGLSLLSLLSPADCRPAILATTSLISPYVLETAESMGVDYLLCKPCTLNAAAARVKDLLARAEAAPAARQDLRSRVTELLLLLGLSTKLNGFKYLREAVCQMVEDPDQSITKELYPNVARACGCAPSHVERSIRGAIQDAWDRRDPGLWLLYFTEDDQSGRPTNAVFISRLSDGLKTGLSLVEPGATEVIPRVEEPLASVQ